MLAIDCRVIVLRWVIVVLAATVAGCGYAAGEAGTVPIDGTVTLDGQPVAGASVAFIGNGGARLATAQTDATGKFTLRAAVGKNSVTVAKGSAPAIAPAASDEPMLMPTEGELAKLPPPPPPSFPAKYGDPNTSGLSFDIKEGMSSIDLALTSK